MRKGQIKNVGYLKERRRELRSNLTPAEAAMWKILQNSKLDGHKFRRQHSIENYIVDFYCPAAKLVIELDGEVHNNPIANQNDYERDEQLKYLGYKVLRFENKLVFEHTEFVLDTILQHVST
ncbi:MAG: endonuclease domain-containing protein [Chitinophagales bacterium]|nr:endonuclease domain-containing protein [Chitinophagales bacterium]